MRTEALTEEGKPRHAGRRLATAGAAAVLAGAMFAGTAVGSAAAMPQAGRTPAPATTGSSQQAANQQVFERFAAAVQSLPRSLDNRPLNDRSVQQALSAAMLGNGNQNRPLFDPVRCGAAVFQFVAETAIPLGKVKRIVQEFGGITEFAKILYAFIKTGSMPANATAELAELLGALTGIPGVIAACS